MTGAPQLLGDLGSIVAESGVAMAAGHQGFVRVRAERVDGSVLVGQLDPPLARALGLSLLEAAESADHDAALFRGVVAAGMDEERAAALVDLVRRHRYDEHQADAAGDDDGAGR